MNATGRKQEGQVLVQVAMLMVVFLAFMAIAIDIGNILTERRRMQNAADAGALAGAWEICFGDPGLAESTAHSYAIDENHAQVADVAIDGGRVTVYAREAANLYVARIFGIDAAQISAMAVATCGGATSLCNLWPLSFHLERWNELPCYPDDGEGTFYVFNDGRFEEDDSRFAEVDGVPYAACDGIYDGDEREGYCDCGLIPPDNRVFRVGPGQRGWLLLPRPREPYSLLGPDCSDNCGDQVRCWIDYGTYTGQLTLPSDTAAGNPTLCIPGQPGVDESVRLEIERDHIGREPNVLIWDRNCEPGEPVTGQCPGDLYHIHSTGCIKIIDVLEYDLLVKEKFWKDPSKPEICMPNVKVIEAMKYCKCSTECGGTNGALPLPGEVRAVSLIK